MSATRCFSCIAFPFPRVVLGSKNIRASKAAPVKSQRSPARATNPGRATTPVPAASCRPFWASVLTSYIEGQCRLLHYCNTHFKDLAYRKLGAGCLYPPSCREGFCSIGADLGIRIFDGNGRG